MRTNLIGNRYGRLTVVDVADDSVSSSGYHTVRWKCLCDCGTEVIVRGKCLTQGVTKSCGCLRREQLSKRVSKHNDQGSRLYAIWDSMRQRCNNPKNAAYHNYGGRGITICSDWDEYLNFKEWAVKSGYDNNATRGDCTLDRIDVNKAYSPSNCRWTDMRTQSNNKRDTIRLYYNGKLKTLHELSQITNIKYHTLWRRYHLGMTTDKILQPTK